jgi:twinkle protein
MTESEFVRHMPCDNCGSSDANSLYTDGHTFCFVCHHRTGSDDEIVHNRNMTTDVLLKGSAERLNKRNISEKTNQFFRIYRDGDTLRFPYFTSDGVLKGIKIKNKKKIFTYEGVSTDTLFAQHLFPSTGKRIVVTEGELDAASCYEAMPGWPMVSLPHGAASAKKDCQKQIPLFQGYEEIILFFDTDDAGRKAVEETASILPPGKVKIARLEGYKDASEALQANDAEAIRKAIWDAKAYRPDGIIDGKTLLEIVTTPQAPYDHEYPFEGLNKKLHGIRYGELVTFTAGSGSGKTSIMRHIATDLLQKGESVGILELEASNRRTALGLMSTAVGQNLQLDEHGEEELRAAFGDSIATWNLFCFDGFGSYDPDLIYNRIEYMATGLDCKIIFLDHLSILLSGLEGDERRMIDTTMTRLRSLVERTGIALFLVSHLRRSGNDRTSHEEGGRVSLSSLRGSHSIAQISDSVIALERDQQAGATGDATTVRILKNRYSGEVGPCCELSYDLNTCRFTEHEITPESDFNPATDF